MSEYLNVRCLLAVESLLREIRVENGYRRDVPVHFERRQFEQHELPVNVVFEGDEVPRPDTANGDHRSMTLDSEMRVETHVPLGSSCTLDLARARADVKRALLVNRGVLRDTDGVLGQLVYAGAQVVLRGDGTDTGAQIISLRLVHPEKFGDPTAHS